LVPGQLFAYRRGMDGAQSITNVITLNVLTGKLIAVDSGVLAA